MFGMVCLLWAVAAHADVVNPPPDDCPEGQIGTTGHLGSRCVPHLCSPSGNCDAGPCTETGMCVLREERVCGDMDTPCTFEEAFGLCDTDEDCGRGACVVDAYCLNPRKVEGEGCGGCESTAGVGAVMALGLCWA